MQLFNKKVSTIGLNDFNLNKNTLICSQNVT